MELYGQRTFLLATKPIRQIMDVLMGFGDGNVYDLRGEILGDLEELHSVPIMLKWSYVHQMILSCVFGRFDDASDYAKSCEDLMTMNLVGPVGGGLILFFSGLAVIGKARGNGRRRAPYARKCSYRLRQWATHAPHNFLGKHLFLDAELAALSGNQADTFSRYVNAISMSREGGFILQTALANERTGIYLMEKGDRERAESFYHKALSEYRKWGATGKVQHLEAQVQDMGFPLCNNL
jgi:hypothetical protein